MSKVLNKRQRGATLIETLLVVFLVVTIGMAINSFQFDIYRTSSILTGSLTAQDEARRALRQLSAELRTTSPSSLGAYPISVAATSSITFYSDIDSDLLKEQVRYFITGTTLKKGVIKPSGAPLTYNSANEKLSTVIYNVRNSTSTPIFLYYDTSYDGTTAALSQPVTLGTIRLIKVNLWIDNDTKKPPPPMNVSTQIAPRNLKDNL